MINAVEITVQDRHIPSDQTVRAQPNESGYDYQTVGIDVRSSVQYERTFGADSYLRSGTQTDAPASDANGSTAIDSNDSSSAVDVEAVNCAAASDGEPTTDGYVDNGTTLAADGGGATHHNWKPVPRMTTRSNTQPNGLKECSGSRANSMPPGLTETVSLSHGPKSPVRSRH
jgi:hypothetical protein